MYFWSRGEGKHRAGGKYSFELQFGSWTFTRAAVDKVMGGKGLRFREGGECVV